MTADPAHGREDHGQSDRNSLPMLAVRQQDLGQAVTSGGGCVCVCMGGRDRVCHVRCGLGQSVTSGGGCVCAWGGARVCHVECVRGEVRMRARVVVWRLGVRVAKAATGGGVGRGCHVRE